MSSNSLDLAEPKLRYWNKTVTVFVFWIDKKNIIINVSLNIFGYLRLRRKFWLLHIYIYILAFLSSTNIAFLSFASLFCKSINVFNFFFTPNCLVVVIFYWRVVRIHVANNWNTITIIALTTEILFDVILSKQKCRSYHDNNWRLCSQCVFYFKSLLFQLLSLNLLYPSPVL